MFFYGLMSMVSPLLGLVLIAWAVVTVWRAVVLPRGTRREPACEKCKYAVADLASFTCPECGSDLRTVGIVTPAIEATRRGSYTTAILAWTFLCGAAIYIVFILSFFFVGISNIATTSANAITTWTQTLTPNSGAYQSVELAYDSNWQSIAGPMDITLLLADGSEHRITLDPGPMKVAGLDDANNIDWDADTIEVWFEKAGLDITDPEIAAEAAETSRVVDLTIMAPTSGYSLTLSHHTSQFVPISGAASTGFATGSRFFDGWQWVLSGMALMLVIYVLGIIAIVRRRRKLLCQVG